MTVRDIAQLRGQPVDPLLATALADALKASGVEENLSKIADSIVASRQDATAAIARAEELGVYAD